LRTATRADVFSSPGRAINLIILGSKTASALISIICSEALSLMRSGRLSLSDHRTRGCILASFDRRVRSLSSESASTIMNSSMPPFCAESRVRLRSGRPAWSSRDYCGSVTRIKAKLGITVVSHNALFSIVQALAVSPVRRALHLRQNLSLSMGDRQPSRSPSCSCRGTCQ